VAEAAQTPAETGAQPKAALNYRMGGDHCGACMHFFTVGKDKGTCPKVTPPNVDAGDVCDAYSPAAREKADEEAGGAVPKETAAMAENLSRRGMISDKQMLGLRGRDI